MNQATDRQRLLIDVTDTLALGLWTGIQRVVRKITGHLLADPDSDVWLVAAIDGRFHRVNSAGIDRLFAARESGHRPAGFAAARRSLKDSALAVLRSVPPLFLRLQGWSLNRRYRSTLRVFTEPAPVVIEPNDRVLLLDTFWNGVSTIDAARHARSRRARIYAYIPDLIAITHPHYVPDLIATAFPRRVKRLLPLLDRALLTSHDAIRQLRAMSRRSAPGLAFGHWPLGSDVAASHGDRPVPRKASGADVFVMIGTIEPRKGHRVALDAFDRIWAAGGSAELVFVGTFGWGDGQLIERCQAHPELGRRLRLVQGASDDALADILAGAAAVIMASEIEGYGLPIVEALATGLPVIASDIPIFREVGGDFVVYFALNDSAALVDAVHVILRDQDRYRAMIAAYEPVSWRESAKLLTAAIQA